MPLRVRWAGEGKKSIGELFQGFFQREREREKKGAVRSSVDTMPDWLCARSDLIIRLTRFI